MGPGTNGSSSLHIQEAGAGRAGAALSNAIATPSSSSRSPTSPFFGRWVDHKGVEVVIDGSEVRGPKPAHSEVPPKVEFRLQGEDSCQMIAGDNVFEGRIVRSKDGVSLQWSDGDSWILASGAAV